MLREWMNEWMNENARILSAFENRLRAGFTSLNGLICLHSVLDKAGSQSVFKRT